MGTIVEDLREAAASIADVANAAGYTFDFSARSLWDVERFLAENTSEGEPQPGSVLSKDLGSRVFALGAYIGEVIRGVIGGDWVSDQIGADWIPDSEVNADLDLDADLAVAVALQTPNGQLWPNQQVMKRIIVGESASITGYATASGVDPGVGPHPSPPA